MRVVAQGCPSVRWWTRIVVLPTAATILLFVYLAKLRFTPVAAVPNLAVQLERNITTSDWGSMGRQVRRLREWGQWWVERPQLDPYPLIDAIYAIFPWLEGSLYTPWTSPPVGDVSSVTPVGMVVCVGSSNYHLAAHLIAVLRRVHRSNVAIEIAYAGDDDLNLPQRLFLQSVAHGIAFIDLLDLFPHARTDLTDSGWAMKPFALLAARSPRTILVDADAIFFASPDDIFLRHAGLRQTGTLFYHDRAIPGNHVEQRTYIKSQLQIAGVPASPYLTTQSRFYAGESWYEQDSGVVAVDKSIPGVFLGLVFAAWMNTKAVRDSFTSTMFHGDKDTFWIAMELSGAPYTFDDGYAGSIGTVDGGSDRDVATDPAPLCGRHMLHLTPAGRAPFWMNGGIYEDKSKPDLGYAGMTHYWVDDGNGNGTGPNPQWWWAPDNAACLKRRVSAGGC